MVGGMMDKVEEVKVSTEDDIDIKTKDKEIHVRKWWMVPVFIGSIVIGIVVILAALALSGAFPAIIAIFK